MRALPAGGLVSQEIVPRRTTVWLASSADVSSFTGTSPSVVWVRRRALTVCRLSDGHATLRIHSQRRRCMCSCSTTTRRPRPGAAQRSAGGRGGPRPARGHLGQDRWRAPMQSATPATMAAMPPGAIPPLAGLTRPCPTPSPCRSRHRADRGCRTPAGPRLPARAAGPPGWSPAAHPGARALAVAPPARTGHPRHARPGQCPGSRRRRTSHPAGHASVLPGDYPLALAGVLTVVWLGDLALGATLPSGHLSAAVEAELRHELVSLGHDPSAWNLPETTHSRSWPRKVTSVPAGGLAPGSPPR